ncbi:MAG: sigma-70 family RNA polymerase sigma factor [Saprospiraceae bacterium]|nr:sigma-70 family RNA polymerase sigma factor [Saprospiraceae bacterium]
MTKTELDFIINGCKQQSRLCQKNLYQLFYNYGMNISHRYTHSEMEAEEIVNEAFIKVFTHIDSFKIEMTFSNWFHTIVVRSSINYLKKYDKNKNNETISDKNAPSIDDEILSKMSADEIFNLIRQLAPTYKAAFNLFVVEGYSHAEIAKLMSITEGTSRSNLLIARQKLQAMITHQNSIKVYGK